MTTNPTVEILPCWFKRMKTVGSVEESTIKIRAFIAVTDRGHPLGFRVAFVESEI